MRSGLVGVDEPSGEHQLERAGEADGAGEEVGAAVPGHQADLDEGRAELGPAGGEPQVAHAREVEAGADRRAVDRGDDRLLEQRQAPGDPLDAVDVAAAQVDRPAGEHPLLLEHALEVAAGRERRARAGEDHAAHLIVAVGVVERAHQAVDHRLAVGVAGVGAVEGQEEHRALAGALEVRELGSGHAPPA
jgi:hypothetical protein